MVGKYHAHGVPGSGYNCHVMAFSNVLALSISQFIRFTAGFVVAVLLARWLGTEGFGTLTYVTGVMAVSAFGASMGMHVLLTRNVARDPKAANVAMGSGMLATALCSVVTAAAMLTYVWSMDGRPVVMTSAAFGAVALGIMSIWQVPQAVLHGLRRMAHQVPGVIAGRAVYVVGVLVFLSMGYGVPGVFAAQILAAITTLLLFVTAVRQAIDVVPETSIKQMRELVRTSVPFGLNLLFSNVYLQSDVLILKEMKGDHELGLYQGAAVLVLQLLILANVLNRGLFPKISQSLGDRSAAADELMFSSRVLLAVSIPIAAGGFVVAEPLMVFLMGVEYAPSALPLMIMLPLLPLRYLNNGFGMALSALDRQPDRTRSVVYAALFNVAANLYAIPRWGAAGAATTTLLTEILLTSWLSMRLSPELDGFKLRGALLRTLIPAIPMVLLVLAIPNLHVLLRIVAGALVYVTVGYGTGAWRTDDPRRLRSI